MYVCLILYYLYKKILWKTQKFAVDVKKQNS